MEDTYKGQVDNPLSLNRYTYTYNNPLRYFDPTGNITVEEGWNSFKKGVGEFFNPKNYEKAVNDLTTPKNYVPLTREFLGPDAFDTLTDGKWDIVSDSKAGLQMGAGIILSRIKFGKVGNLAKEGYINANKIRFTQSSIKNTFKDGQTFDALIDGLKSGRINPKDIPAIRVFESDGKIYSLDNRRLHVFQEAGVDVPYRFATKDEIEKEVWKFTTQNDGITIKVRGR